MMDCIFKMYERYKLFHSWEQFLNKPNRIDLAFLGWVYMEIQFPKDVYFIGLTWLKEHLVMA